MHSEQFDKIEIVNHVTVFPTVFFNLRNELKFCNYFQGVSTYFSSGFLIR